MLNELKLQSLMGGEQGLLKGSLSLPEPAQRSAKEVGDALAALQVEYKAGDETRLFRYWATSETQDSYGDVIRLDGWGLERYKSNPVFLWGHNYQEVPIGISAFTWIDPEATRPGSSAKGALLIDVLFNADSNEFALKVEAAAKNKIVRAVSVGFLPLEWKFLDRPQEYGAEGMSRPGNVFTRQELLECSLVTVPANPDALQLATKCLGRAEGLKIFGVSEERAASLYAKEGGSAVLGFQARKVGELEALFYSIQHAATVKAPLDVLNVEAKARLLSLGLDVGATKAEIEDLAASIGLWRRPQVSTFFRAPSAEPPQTPTTKAGAVLNKRNKARLTDALALIKEVLAEAEAPETQEDALDATSPRQHDDCATRDPLDDLYRVILNT